ncbi:F-box protein At3g57590-like [Nicotiana tomentosiformis]|uniref:F-box protein At3g57590-like n=1 Tax=Nicotiana tomentosiformis TaxID=4098 RepID=UPI00051B2D90|nr:F-box protein At3g57590-like isoform X1 [Nicotiana tomentosiformis]
MRSSKFLVRTRQPRKEKFYYYSCEHDGQNQKLGKKTKSTSILGGVSYHKVEYAKGLFCLWSENFEPVFIFNPTTRESRFLPRLDIDFSTNYQCHCSLGFDPNLKKHKVLMTIYDPKMKLTRHCWVFTLGETTWREINCDRITNFYPKTNYEGVYVDGAVYFYCGHCNIYGLDIVAFNCRIEEVRIISLWDNYRNYGMRIGRRFNLVELEGKLAAIDVMFNYMRVWILQSPETGEWIRQLEIVIPPQSSVATYGNFVVHRRCTSTTDKKEIAFTKPNNDPTNRILFYDLKENKWRSERILGLAENAKIIGIYNYEYCIYSV